MTRRLRCSRNALVGFAGRAIAQWSFLLFALSCTPTVTRVQDGTTVKGSAISSEAYASYLQGHLLELAGRDQEAETHYEKTLRLDSSAHEAYTRLGVIRCQRRANDARKAFERAESLAPRSVALWEARTTCALLTNDLVMAEQAATRLFQLAPQEPRSGHLLILAHRLARHIDRAKLVAWGHVSRYPTDTFGWQLLASLHTGSLRSALLAEAALRTKLVEGSHHTDLEPQLSSVVRALGLEQDSRELVTARAEYALTDALYRNDPLATERAAGPLLLSSRRMAELAYARGAYEQAYQEARRAASIAPENWELYSLALTLADLLDKPEEFASLLKAAPASTSATSDVVRTRILEIVARRTPAAIERTSPSPAPSSNGTLPPQ